MRDILSVGTLISLFDTTLDKCLYIYMVTLTMLIGLMVKAHQYVQKMILVSFDSFFLVT